MKALQLIKPGELVFTDLEKPKPSKGEALLEIVSMGICGSDISAYKGMNPTIQYPRIIGHELGGIVLEIGENEKGIHPGDRVVVDPYLYCGSCYACSIGRTNCCGDLKVLGTQIDGGMQEYLVHPAQLLHKVPDNIPWEYVPITETMAISLHSTRRAGVKAGEYYAIFGAGPIGLLAALIGKICDAQVILIDVVQERLEKARELGISNLVNSVAGDVEEQIKDLTHGTMAQAVLEASGANQAITDALRVASQAGRVVFTGWPKHPTQIDTAMITKKELDVRGSRTANREFEDCLELISTGRISLDGILSHTCSFEELPQEIKRISENPGYSIKSVALRGIKNH